MEATPKSCKVKQGCSLSSPTESLESSPCNNTEQKSLPQCHQKLSSSLKERLKRSRRSFTSPCSVAKRLCVDNSEEKCVQVPADSPEDHGKFPPLSHDVDVNQNDTRSRSERFSGPVPASACLSTKDVNQQLERLRKEVKEKTETLRRLKMVKMYRSKNNLTELQVLIDKWRSCAQAALYELQSDVVTDGQKASLSQLFDLFGLDHDLLHFDRTEEDFTT